MTTTSMTHARTASNRIEAEAARVIPASRVPRG